MLCINCQKRFFVVKSEYFKGASETHDPLKIFKYPHMTFSHRNCLKSGVCGSGSENFKTGNKAYDHKPNIHAPKNDIYGPKIA